MRPAARLSFLIIILVSFLSAQEDSTKITIDRLFMSGDFRGEYFGPAKWLMDSDYYTTVEKSDSIKGGRDIVKYSAANGNKEIVVPAQWLIPQGKEEPLSIASYSWSENGKYLLIFTNTRRVWRRNTRGDYWVLNLKTKKLWQIGKGLPESSLMFAKFSPGEDEIAYVSRHNIYVENLEDGQITQLTDDGSDVIINGTFDWVYEEELSLRDGFRWSPDGEKIAFWQLDASGIGVYYMLNTTDSIYSEVIPVQYPKVGTKNSAARIGVVELDDREITWMKIPGDPRNHYLARMDWAAGDDEICVQQLNRKQNTNTIYLCDADDGSAEVILTEKDDAWVDINNDLKWLNGGDDFTWVSDRSGWRHIYLVSRDGKDIRPITGGEYDVISILKIDDKNNTIYFYASPENATQRYLYSVELKENGKVTRLTPKSLPGTNRYTVSNNGRWAFHSYSSFNDPGYTDLVTLPAHRSVKKLAANDALKEKLKALDIRRGEFFRIKGENGVIFDGWKIVPPDFDPGKKYPVLFYVYGEPAGVTVTDGWRGRSYLWHQMLAQRGYIVMSVDNRGTPAPRGREWRKSVYRKIGVIASEDQAAALHAILNKWNYLDKERVAIWGWSGGGAMTLNMMFRYPDDYHVGMAVAPVSKERLYDTIYEERYMGLIDEEGGAENYRLASPVTYAENLKGDLLIVHGTGDDNVHYQNTEVVINALVKYNKQFTMMAYPNRSHGIYEGQNTTRHLYTLLTNYLLNHLPAGGR
jgi:dipeptidyl-peptidase-4